MHNDIDKEYEDNSNCGDNMKIHKNKQILDKIKKYWLMAHWICTCDNSIKDSTSGLPGINSTNLTHHMVGRLTNLLSCVPEDLHKHPGDYPNDLTYHL